MQLTALKLSRIFQTSHIPRTDHNLCSRTALSFFFMASEKSAEKDGIEIETGIAIGAVIGIEVGGIDLDQEIESGVIHPFVENL